MENINFEWVPFFNELAIKLLEYENNQILPIISICDKLKIPFEIDQDDFENIKTEIENIKKRTSFLETTYTWKWYTTNDVIKRSEIVLNFIKAQII